MAASQEEVERALAAAAEAISDQPLTLQQKASLKQGYLTTKGSALDRALRAIDETLNITDRDRREKCAASDNANRRVNDLANAINALPKRP